MHAIKTLVRVHFTKRCRGDRPTLFNTLWCLSPPYGAVWEYKWHGLEGSECMYAPPSSDVAADCG